MERLSGVMGGKFFATVIPVLLGLAGAFAANLPISFLGGLVPPPLLALMPVYFWCLVRPDLMPPAWAFAIGVLEDVLSGGPPGVWAAAFVATYAVIDRQRDAFAGLSSWGAIVGFATAALAACVTAYIIVAVYYWHLPPVAPVMGVFAMTVVFYAPVAFVLGAIHRRFVGPLRSDF